MLARPTGAGERPSVTCRLPPGSGGGGARGGAPSWAPGGGDAGVAWAGGPCGVAGVALFLRFCWLALLGLACGWRANESPVKLCW